MLSSSKIGRRSLLKTIALGASASCLPGSPMDLLAVEPAGEPCLQHEIAIPDDGWQLWADTQAQWREDEIFLPEDVAWIDGRLCGKGRPLAVNPPTGGWERLEARPGKQVTLPASVEQHFWGQFGAGADGKPRPYTPEEYRYAAANPPLPPADDQVPQNGAYYGVSWFYRAIDIPARMAGQRIYLNIRGAHLRAEVYLNGQLCGYSIMEELPFEADLSHAAKAGGANLLAIRITNPFGRFDWVDGMNAQWGQVNLYRSHGFGALDRGLALRTAAGPVRVKSAYVLNTPAAHSVAGYAILEALSGSDANGFAVTMAVVDPDGGKILSRRSSRLEPMRAGETTTVNLPFDCPEAALWKLDRPKLYELHVFLGDAGLPDRPAAMQEPSCAVRFGFRSFAVTGLGTNAMLRLNQRRIRIYTAISWGFWGLNGIFPVPELAEKEVRAAQQLGLNCLNFHRNLAKEDVLRKHDELGVLRYMEPGAGKLAIGRLPKGTAPNISGIVMQKPDNEADRFAQRFMFVKCVEMVKAFRSHPSVMEYCLQNEIGADLKNPATLAVLKAMHDEDPSRCVVLNDGFVARGAAQAWYEPWSLDEPDGKLTEGKLHRSDEEKWGGWWNNHQGAGDQWYDEFYKSPTQYTYQAPASDVITEFGEMEGCARPDNHALMVEQIEKLYAKYGGTSYDLGDHEAIVAGYEKFLDRWGFRKAFPTAEAIFTAAGRTCYESWANYLENVRISDALDFAAISGWESTAIENHSGIVDNLRNFKSDPELIRGSLLPIRPIAKQRSLAIERGQAATFDLYLANDTPLPAAGTLTFTMIAPSGKKQQLAALPAPEQHPDVFSYLLREALQTPPLDEEGLYRFEFSLSSIPVATQTKQLWVTASPWAGVECRQLKLVAVSGISAELRKQLEEAGGGSCFKVVDFVPGQACDLLVSSGMTAETASEEAVGETTGEQMPAGGRHHEPAGGAVATPALGSLAPGIFDAVRKGTPLLAMPGSDALSEGVARELAGAGAFAYNGAVGDFRAPWMGNWYFVREHELFAGMPVNCAMGGFYQVSGRQSNGLLIDRAANGPEIEVLVGYSRDHDRNVGAGTFLTRLGRGQVLFHRLPPMHPVMQRRFLGNALKWLTRRAASSESSWARSTAVSQG